MIFESYGSAEKTESNTGKVSGQIGKISESKYSYIGNCKLGEKKIMVFLLLNTG